MIVVRLTNDEARGLIAAYEVALAEWENENWTKEQGGMSGAPSNRIQDAARVGMHKLLRALPREKTR